MFAVIVVIILFAFYMKRHTPWVAVTPMHKSLVHHNSGSGEAFIKVEESKE